MSMIFVPVAPPNCIILEGKRFCEAPDIPPGSLPARMTVLFGIILVCGWLYYCLRKEVQGYWITGGLAVIGTAVIALVWMLNQ